jgi:Endomembrane protein 70
MMRRKLWPVFCNTRAHCKLLHSLTAAAALYHFLFAVETNSLVSSETEMPYEYYSMPFCKPENGVKKSSSSTNPGTILLGIRIENSPYNFSMMVS